MTGLVNNPFAFSEVVTANLQKFSDQTVFYREFSRDVTSCMTTVSFSVYVRFCPPCVGVKWKLE